MTDKFVITDDDQVALTTEELQVLESILATGDRAGFCRPGFALVCAKCVGERTKGEAMGGGGDG